VITDDSESAESERANESAPRIQEVANRDGSVLMLPVGIIEQHGSHLPVVTDTLPAKAVAVEGAIRVRDELPVLVAPPIWSGFSPHHTPFGGTLTVEMETLVTLLEDVAASAIENGFDAVLSLNGTAGTHPSSTPL
jgi:creatinine amidohydrolase